MQNTAFNQLATYPFWRLNNLLENIPKPPNFDEIALQIGEPKIPPPKFVADIIAENANIPMFSRALAQKKHYFRWVY